MQHENVDLTNGPRFLYAMGDFCSYGMESLIRLFLLFYLTEFVGLQPSIAALLLVAGVLWDAVSDPLMGWISDSLYTLVGGRSAFVYAGSLITGCGFGFLFTSHLWGFESPMGILALYILTNTGLTVFSVPHTSIPGDFPFSAKTRNQLFALRFGFGNLGALAAAVLVAAVQAIEEDFLFLMVILIFTSLSTAIALASGYGTQTIEHLQKQKQKQKQPSRQMNLGAFIRVFQNSAFVPLLAGYLLANIGIGINSSAALYYYKDYLQLTEKETGIILVVFFLVIAISLVAWTRIAERYGKLKPLQFGVLVLGVGGCIAFPSFPVGNFWWPLLVAAVFLGSMVGCVILLDSILTDVADFGELKTGEATTAIYFGIWKFTSKFARAIAIGITGWILEGRIQFGAQGGSRSETVGLAVERLPWLFGPGVGAFLILAAVLLSLYQFREPKQRQVQLLIAQKRARKF